MFKNLCRSLLVVLILVCSVATVAAPVDLKLKFRKGETFEQSIQIKNKGTMGPEGTQMPIDTLMKMRLAFDVLEVNGDQSAQLKSSMKELKISGMPMVQGELDYAEILGLKDQSMQLTIDSRGNVIATEGAESLGGPGAMPGSPMSNSAQFEYFPTLPDHPVEVDETWVNEKKVQLPGASVEGVNREEYVLRGIKEWNGIQVAVIGMKSKAEVKDATMSLESPGSMGAEVQMTYCINSMNTEKEGEMLMDIEKGRLLGADLVIKTRGDISISTGVQGENFPSTIKTVSNMDTDVVYRYGEEETPDLSSLYTKREEPTEQNQSTTK